MRQRLSGERQEGKMKKCWCWCIIVLAALLCTGCGGVDPEGREYCRVNGANLYFVTEEEKAEWETELSALLSNPQVGYNDGYDGLAFRPYDPDRPAIARPYSCALFDITEDGVPELFVASWDSFGSSGVTSCHVYDIQSGAELGTAHGMGWRQYYDAETGEIETAIIRLSCGGAVGETQSVCFLRYDSTKKECYEEVCLQAYHEIEPAGIREDVLEETYPSAKFQYMGQSVTLHEYHRQYLAFLERYIPLPETEMISLDSSKVTESEDSPEVAGQKWARALLATEQQFLMMP